MLFVLITLRQRFRMFHFFIILSCMYMADVSRLMYCIVYVTFINYLLHHVASSKNKAVIISAKNVCKRFYSRFSVFFLALIAQKTRA